MYDWKLTPEYINAEWTEEQFILMFKMRNKRKLWESGKAPKPQTTNMSSDAFLAACGVTPTVQ